VESSIDVDAVRALVEQAQTHVGRKPGRTPLRSALYWLTRGRIDKRPSYILDDVPRLDTPWQDTVSGRYFGWRCREAVLQGEFAFAVEYVICRTCRIGWVDNPYTAEEYQGHGLGSAGLRALREENPDLEWYTGSGHLSHSRPFWQVVGQRVPGGYRPRDLCDHLARSLRRR
jgi:GNAT superfamily N-acetyltransferase